MHENKKQGIYIMSHNHKYSKDLLKYDVQYHQLFNLHEELESAIKELKQHPSADHVELTSLKRHKLRVCDQLEKMKLGGVN